MGDLLEAAVEVAADALGRRQRVELFGMFLLELFELFEKHIELAVGDCRRVLDIVGVVMAVYLVAQGDDTGVGV